MRKHEEIKDALELATALAEEEFRNNPPKVGDIIICPHIIGSLMVIGVSESRVQCIDKNQTKVSIGTKGCYRLHTLMSIAVGTLWEEHFLPNIDLSNILK